MMFPLASFLFSFVGLVLATYTDFRDRTIPNWISVGLGVMGLGLAAFEYVQTQNLSNLVLVVGVTLVTYIVAYLFWRLGAWSGGDVKLFAGLGALNPVNPFVLGSFFSVSWIWGNQELFRPSMLPFFMLNLFILSVIMLLPYTAFLSVSVLRNNERRNEFFSITKKSVVESFAYGLLVLLFTRLVEGVGLPIWMIVLLMVVSAFLPRMARIFLVLLTVLLGFFSIVSFSSFPFLFATFLIIGLIFSWYKFAQRHVLTRIKKISDLQEGDIVGEIFRVRGDKIVREEPVSFKNIIKAGLQRDVPGLMSVFHAQNDIVASPRQAAGLYSEQVARLQGEVKKGSLEDRVVVKASSPFAPAVLLAYGVLNLVGDIPLVWWFG